MARNEGASAADTTDGEPAPAIDHYPNGNVRYRGFHLDGEMHGDWTFYRADGTIMRTGTFDRGRQVGRWTTHTRAGGVLKATEFPRDVRGSR